MPVGAHGDDAGATGRGELRGIHVGVARRHHHGHATADRAVDGVLHRRVIAAGAETAQAQVQHFGRGRIDRCSCDDAA